MNNLQALINYFTISVNKYVYIYTYMDTISISGLIARMKSLSTEDRCCNPYRIYIKA